MRKIAIIEIKRVEKYGNNKAAEAGEALFAENKSKVIVDEYASRLLSSKLSVVVLDGDDCKLDFLRLLFLCWL